MSQRNLYKHYIEHSLIVNEHLVKDTNLFWFTDESYMQMNHTQRSGIRYQLKGAGFHQKAFQLQQLTLTKSINKTI